MELADPQLAPADDHLSQLRRNLKNYLKNSPKAGSEGRV